MGIFNIFSKKSTNNEQAKGAASPSSSDDLPDAGTIFFNSMVELGCQPERLEDGKIGVKFQGENFVVFCYERIIHVMDFDWSRIPVDDPNIALLYEAINQIHIEFGGYSIFLCTSKEEGIRIINARVRLMLHPGCPDNTIYIYNSLINFFGIHRRIQEIYNELMAQSQAASEQGKRPVGFAPSAGAPEQGS